jgi:hypothetical protein
MGMLLGHPNLGFWGRFRGNAYDPVSGVTATLTGSPTFNTDGMVCNGDDTANFGNVCNIGAGTALTLVSVVKTAASGANMVLFDKANTSVNDLGYRTGMGPTGIFSQYIETAAYATNYIKIISTPALNDGIKHTVITSTVRGNAANGSITAYLDGASMAGTVTQAGDVTTNVDNTMVMDVGSRVNNNAGSPIYFTGTLGDQMVIKNLAVSAGDAKRLSLGFGPMMRS